MRYTISTNFDNYSHEINFDEKGVITLTLKPIFIDNILLKQSNKLKKGATIFNTRYCTLYKKNSNEYFYRFTLHEPWSFTSYHDSKNNKIVDYFKCNIASENNYPYINSRYERKIKKYENKFRKYDIICSRLYSKYYN